MSNSKNRVSVSGKIYGKAYEYGSAARQLNMNAQPLRLNEESEESREQRRAKQKQIRHNNKINLMYTVVVATVASVVFFICYQYLNVQAEADINASIDYDAIYDTAVNDLGMIYPGKGQVITYDSKESEYVKQFKDVPEAGK